VILAGAMTPAMAVVQLVLPPKWTELTAEKQQILSPLSAEWDRLEATRKKKWLEIANRYPTMGQEEQARVQRRMKAWVKMTPEERKVAREKYQQQVKQASPEQREALKQRWSEYESLPDDQKQRLKESAAAKAATTKSDPKSNHGTRTVPPGKPSLIPPIKQPPASGVSSPQPAQR
jgi:hypothetical protein